jgi:hypothetical protein
MGSARREKRTCRTLDPWKILTPNPRRIAAHSLNVGAFAERRVGFAVKSSPR